MTKQFTGSPPIGINVCKSAGPAKSYRFAPLKTGQDLEKVSNFVITCADGSQEIVAVEQRVLIDVYSKAVQR